MRVINLFRRLGPYTVGVMVSFATSILALPALIHLLGPREWAGIAVIQAIASVATVFVTFGWAVTGPNRVATADPSTRPSLLVKSVYARLCLYVLAALAGSTFSALVSGLSVISAVLAFLGYSLPALGAVWYFVGEQRPTRMLLLDALPRAAGTVTGVVAVFFLRDSAAFSAAIFIWGIISLALTYVVALRRTGPLPRFSARSVISELRAQTHGVVATASSSLYSNAALIVCSLIAPNEIEVFALAFKIYNYAGAALVPVLQFTQGWIPDRNPGVVSRRVRSASRVAMLAGIVILGGCLLLLPWAVHLLSAGRISIGWNLVLPISVSIGLIVLSQVVGQASLIALGGEGTLAASMAAGSVCGIVLEVIGAMTLGAVGIATAMAVTDLCVVVAQSLRVRTLLRRIPA